MFKRILLLATLSLLFTFSHLSYAVIENVSIVEQAIELGYVPEKLQNNYKQPITREEVAELIITAIFSDLNDTNSRVKLYMKESWRFPEMTVENFLKQVTTTQVFQDTDNSYIKIAYLLGFMNPDSENKFHPKNLVKREEAARMVSSFPQNNIAPCFRDANILADYDDISPEYKLDVSYAFESKLMPDYTPFFIDENENITAYPTFNPQGYLTRQEAIEMMYYIGRNYYNIIYRLNLRGFVYTNMDMYMSDIEIDGNTVKFKANGYHNRYTTLNNYISMWDDYHSDCVDTYDSEILSAIIFTPQGLNGFMLNDANMQRFLDGEYLRFDYGSLIIEHNKDGYLTVVTKTKDNGYFGFAGGLLFCEMGFDRFNEEDLRGFSVKLQNANVEMDFD